MSEYFDVISFKKTKNDKVIAVRLGSAKKRDDGGFNCWLDAFPASAASGQFEIQIVPQRDKKASAKPSDDMSDSIPF